MVSCLARRRVRAGQLRQEVCGDSATGSEACSLGGGGSIRVCRHGPCRNGSQCDPRGDRDGISPGDNPDPDNGSISRIFDGTGLTVGDPGDPSTWTHNDAWQDNWQGQGSFTSGQTPGAWLVADLGAVHTDLANLYVWNVREVLDRGVQGADVYVSASPSVLPVTGSPYDFSSGGWAPLGPQSIPQASAGDTPADAEFDLTGVPGRYFGFDIQSNYGSTIRVGIAEMQFTVIPEPTTLALAGLGLLGLALRRRFRAG